VLAHVHGRPAAGAQRRVASLLSCMSATAPIGCEQAEPECSPPSSPFYSLSLPQLGLLLLSVSLAMTGSSQLPSLPPPTSPPLHPVTATLLLLRRPSLERRCSPLWPPASSRQCRPAARLLRHCCCLQLGPARARRGHSWPRLGQAALLRYRRHGILWPKSPSPTTSLL